MWFDSFFFQELIHQKSSGLDKKNWIIVLEIKSLENLSERIKQKLVKFI